MSTVKANDLTNVTGGIPTVKSQQLIPTAWVNFNGTGTVAIRDSEGVSSITDNSTGNYYVNFTTNMSSTNYATLSDGGLEASPTYAGKHTNCTTYEAARVRVSCTAGNSETAYQDFNTVSIAIMGGQA
jgi:hypothetical protein